MLEINTIQDYFSLSSEQQGDICRNIKTVERLKGYLQTLNNPKPTEDKPPEWVPCKKCETRGWVLDEHVARNNADVHASTIHKCLKYIWYGCSDYANQGVSNISPESRLIFDHGHTLHYMLQSYGRKGAWGAPVDYQPEAVILPDEQEAIERKAHVLPEAIKYRIRSSVDAVLWRYIVPNVRGLGDVSIRLIHEYKSISPGRPNKDGTMYGGYAGLNGPKPEHKHQATIYSHCFNVPIVVFVYYNKGNDQLIDFPIPYSSVTWNYVKSRIEKVLRFVDEGVPPPWEYTSAIMNPAECNTCDYLHICNPPKKLELV